MFQLTSLCQKRSSNIVSVEVGSVTVSVCLRCPVSSTKAFVALRVFCLQERVAQVLGQNRNLGTSIDLIGVGWACIGGVG